MTSLPAYSQLMASDGAGLRLRTLTERENKILTAVLHGLTNRAVSEHFSISVNTTKFHLRNIYRKLGVNSRTQAAVKALESFSAQPARGTH